MVESRVYCCGFFIYLLDVSGIYSFYFYIYIYFLETGGLLYWTER